MRRSISWILAGLGPLGVAGLAFRAVLTVESPAKVQREAEHGGRVLNGRLLPADGLAEALAEAFESGVPPILVVGNSYANADIDADALAVALGRAPGDATVVSIPSSVGAHWYAVLARHVWRPGVPGPEHVVVVGSAQSLLQTRPATEGAWAALAELGSDPTQDARVGWRSPALDRVRAGRSRVRGAAVGWVRDRSVGLLAPALAGEADDLLGRAFADARMDPARAAARWGLVDTRKGWRPEDLPEVEGSFVGPIADLVAAHGARLSVVRVPVSPRIPAGHGDLVPAETLNALASALGDQWVDLSGMPFPEWAFANLDHLAPEGRERFTALLGQVLRSRPGADLFGPNPTPTGWRLPPRRWTPSPAPPAIGVGAIEVRARGLRSAELGRTELSDLATRALHPRGARCSPWRVIGPDGPLEAGLPCGLVPDHPDTSCHGRDRLFWSARRDWPWVVRLDPDRSCDGAAWLYPDDRLSAAWTDPPVGAAGLDLAIGWAGAPGTAAVVLRVGGEARATAEIGAEPVSLRFEPPVAAGEAVWLEVRNGSGWGLLTRAALTP